MPSLPPCILWSFFWSVAIDPLPSLSLFSFSDKGCVHRPSVSLLNGQRQLRSVHSSSPSSGLCAAAKHVEEVGKEGELLSLVQQVEVRRHPRCHCAPLARALLVAQESGRLCTCSGCGDEVQAGHQLLEESVGRMMCKRRATRTTTTTFVSSSLSTNKRVPLDRANVTPTQRLRPKGCRRGGR